MNPESFQSLFEGSKDKLFRFIRLRTGKREDALDLLQDTYLDFWKAIQNGNFVYSREAETLAFLYLIARRKIAKFYRFSKPKFNIEDLSGIASEDPSVEPGETSLILREVEKLSEEDREVIKLHYFEGLGFKVIGNLLGKEENTIKVRHHRALAKIRQLLGYDPSTDSGS